jgi:hypothetical protein
MFSPAYMPHVTGSVLTSAANLQQGKRVPVQAFTSQDFVNVLVDFQWDAVGQNAGSHDVQWLWYHDDKLVSKVEKNLLFKNTPYTLRSSRAAATLGVGHFKVEVLVDGTLASSSAFDITAS